MYLTQKIRIFPAPTQTQVMWILSEKCRLIYNFALRERMDNWNENKSKSKEEKTYVNYQTQQNQLPSLKSQFPEYKWVYLKVLQTTLKKLDANFKSFFALWNHGHTDAQIPKFKGKSISQRYALINPALSSKVIKSLFPINILPKFRFFFN